MNMEMDPSNNIALVDKLLESLIPSENKHSSKETKRLKKLVISELFGLSSKTNTECTKDIPADPTDLLKTDILSQALKTTSSKAEYDACVDKMYNTIDRVLPMCDSDTLDNLFIFLHKMFELDRSKQIAQKKKICEIPVCKNNRLYSEIIPYQDINWSAFYENLPSVSGSFSDYPFYKEPGDGIYFFKEHIAEFKVPSSNVANLFDSSFKIWRFDINKQVEPVAQDEGFVTPGSEFSNESMKDEDSISQCSDQFSDLDMINYNIEISNRRSWDHLGEMEVPKELPFTSESVGTVLHLWKIVNSSQAVGIKSVPIGNQVSFEDLIMDLKYLLFGMASPSFFFNEELKVFQICDRLHTETLSPEILAALCKDVLKCANYYYSLNLFTEERLKTMSGIVHQTFRKSIQQILNMYKYSLLNMEWENIKHLSSFPSLIIPLQRKLKFLTNICLIQDSPNESNFFSGVQFLDYLYQNLFKIYSSDLSYMLFYMFESCCNAYFRIISEWIFDGCFSTADNYGEFFIEIRREYELCRDWRRVTCIGIRDKKVPNILRKFYKEIFICGKSINLLKICSSREILDKLVGKNHPDLVCCFNQKQMMSYEEKWRKYQTIHEGHFIDRVKIKDKLLKNCAHPNFYNEVRRVREEWFRQQTEIKTSEKNENSDGIENPEKDYVNNIEEAKNESDELKTSENESQSNDSISRNEPTAEEVKSDPTPVESDPVIKTIETTDPVNVTITFTSSDQSPHQKSNFSDLIFSNDASSTPQSKPLFSQGAGDCSGSTENRRVKHLVSLLEQKSRLTDENTPSKTPKKIHLGSGDIGSAGPSEVLKDIGNVSQVEYAKNKLRSMASCINSPIDEKSAKSKLEKGTPLSACQENKLKVMSSEYHNRLNDSLNSSHEMPKSKPAVLTICQENKLKVMSSEYHVRLNESIDSSQKPKAEPSKPTAALTALQENKLKVMSSEYHHRLSTSSITDQTPVKANKPLSASEENKLKVMSSEYHIRLQTNTDNESKSKPCGLKELTESQKNKLKVMSSEYHHRLSLDPVNTETASTPKNLTEKDLIKQKVLQEEYYTKPLQDDTSNLSPIVARDDLSKITEEGESNAETLEEITKQPITQSIEKHVYSQDTEIQPKRTNIFTQDLQNFELQSINNVDVESVADVDITSLTFYLARSIAVPLKIQMKLINEAILKVFIEEESYLDHLTALRDYLLLRKPEFTVSLTNSIFKLTEKAKKPYILLNNYTLSSVLQRALLASGTKETITFGRKLSFSIDDAIPENFTLIDIKELDCLNLTYAIKWPINILITEPIAKKYTKIFRFLFQLHRVLWVLKRDFVSMKNLKRGKSIQYMKIQLFRHNMTQIVKILQEYVMREAIETCWNDFVENLTSADVDLDLLYMSHLKYVNRMMQRCFLCDLSSQCRDSILNLFSMILKYHEALKSGVWRRNVEVNFLYHTNFKEIDAIYQDFVKSLNLVRTNLRQLVYGKQKTYFETLYLELSKNAEEVV